jgi:site-specific recombinase XerD
MMRQSRNEKETQLDKELKGFERYLRYERKKNGRKICKSLAESTIRNYVKIVRRVIAGYPKADKSWIEGIGLGHTSEDLKRYYEDTLKKEFSNNGLVPICIALKHWCGYKSFDFEIPLHYAQEVPVEVLTEKEMDTIINKALKEDDLLYSSLFLAMRETGQRINDVLAINAADIDFNALKIHMTIKKLGNLKHDALISAKLANVLRKYIARQRIEPNEDHDAVWISDKRMRISSVAVLHRLKRYAVKCGIRKRVYNHLFRHSTITIAVERGVPMKTIMDMYKIKNTRTLARYSHPSEEHKRSEFNRVVNGTSPKGMTQEPQKSAIMSDDDDRQTRLKAKLEEAYVLGNVTREGYEEGLRRIEGLGDIEKNHDLRKMTVSKSEASA